MKRLTNGSWLVIGLVLLAVLLALIALKFRRFPHEWERKDPAATQPSSGPVTAG